MYQIFGLLLSLLLLYTSGQAQRPLELTSSKIYQKLEKLGTLANVLYIAAHPDDENTSLISYFSNEKHYETTYLSLTRGDGGQNLIGPEIGPLLGVIRTQELLAARGVDGGKQLFTRAIDFGYSKSPEESFQIWNKEKVLHDVVFAIRKIRPDVIVNRFDHRTPGRTHGHHTGSAILSNKAFDLANDPSVFPEQMEYVEPWQPSRLYFNTSWWFYGSEENFKNADKSNMTSIDVGVYYPLLGLSNTEISAVSRSQHRCQGFGRIGTRGEEKEYLEFLKGDKPMASDPFSGINTTWNRVPGGDRIQKDYENMMSAYQFDNPSKVIPHLVALYQKIKAMPDHAFKDQKLNECLELIQACSGLYLEVRTEDNRLIPGEQVNATWEMVNRSNAAISVQKLEILPMKTTVKMDQSLAYNLKYQDQIQIDIPDDAPFTNPYWLDEPYSLGLYEVENPEWIGLPETPQYLKAVFTLEIEGQKFELIKDVVHKIGKPERGEIYRPVEIIPAYSIEIQNPILFFNKGETKPLAVTVRNHGNRAYGDTLTLKIPDSFTSRPEYLILDDKPSGTYTFEITGPDHNTNKSVQAQIITQTGRIYDQSLTTIDYEHIPLQTVLQPAVSTLVSLQINSNVNRIGYIQGAGDEIPRFLSEIGIQSDNLNTSMISQQDLSDYDAIVLGIRALNTIDDIGIAMPYLLQYAESGGTLIIQYNTGRSLKTNNFAPYDLTISNDRITDENSPVRIIQPDHPAMNQPNKITLVDFDGWVQERGLYFPREFSDKYETIVEFQDPGEEFLPSGLLIAPYGDGHYVYTGLSFFRELPAGVTGAFKLFVNLLSLSKDKN